jgi:tripartite ATP-independent transporter DctM subunit
MCLVALPQMREYKYYIRLAVGTIAAGGTLGILIPPSIAFVIYAIITKESIGKLLLAGFIPGLLLAFVFMLTIYLKCKKNPDLGPPGPSAPLKERILTLRYTWAALVLFLLVIGGLYLGIFVPTEAAAVGAFGALVIGLANRSLSRKDFFKCIFDTARFTAMIFIIIFGANVFGYFVARTKIPFLLVDFINGLAVPRLAILAILLFMYILLGCVMEAYAMIVLTLPIYFPLILALGFDPIWYGVLMVIMIEMGMITPPVGLNVYVVHGVAGDVPLMDIFRGALPFVIAMVICIIILIAFPQVVLFLPNTMK